MQVCTNPKIFRNDVYWRVCENWDHQDHHFKNGDKKTCISGVTITENAPGWVPGISTWFAYFFLSDCNSSQDFLYFCIQMFYLFKIIAWYSFRHQLFRHLGRPASYETHVAMNTTQYSFWETLFYCVYLHIRILSQSHNTIYWYLAIIYAPAGFCYFATLFSISDLTFILHSFSWLMFWVSLKNSWCIDEWIFCWRQKQKQWVRSPVWNCLIISFLCF